MTVRLLIIPPALAQVSIEDKYAFGNIKNLGQGVDLLVGPAFTVAMVAVVLYFVAGAFKYLTSGGDKESLGGAIKMMTHAVIGFVLVMFTFFILPYLLDALFGISMLKIIRGL